MPNEVTPNRNNNHVPRVDQKMRLRTLLLVTAFLIVGFGLLVYQLYALQLRDAEQYRTEAVSQQLQDEVLPATRGSIYGATGKLLATSTTRWNIVADPSYSKSVDPGYLRTAAEQIATLLANGTTADAVYDNLAASDKQYRVLARGVEKPVTDAILEYAANFRLPAAEGETGKRILSLRTEQTSTRSYPYGAFMSSVLGFCNSEGEGFYGLERSYETVLAGTPGRSIAETNVSGEVLANTQAEVYAAIDGNNLNLTIDENVQSIIEKYLNEALDTFDVHSRASAIVMNVNTGAVLGMATVQQYDPNDPYTIYDETMSEILENGLLDANTTNILESRLGEKEVADIVVDGQIDADEYTAMQGMMREAQWRNKNISELYYPGSVFKLVTASAGLDSGVMSPDQIFYCNGALVVNEGSKLWEHTYGCALGAIHGQLDLAGALNHSCNLYFIQAAQKMQPSVFYDYFEAFGFTKPTGIDLPAESRWMIYYNEEELETVNTNLYAASFGQNMGITPLQMATAVAAVANGGYLVTPYVVDSVTDNAGNVVSKTEPNIRRQVMSEEVSKTLLAMMENNVDPNGEGDYHSCKNAYVAGYRIGGKSGTAERNDRSTRFDGDYYKTMDFAAVLPINDPEIEVMVVIDDPRWVQDLASEIVAPVVGNIISEVAPYLGIEQDPNYDPTGEVLVQDCRNYSWTGAQVALNVQGLSHKLIGPSGTIVYQYPYGGTKVPAGSTIYLYTTSDQNSMTTVPDVVGKTGSFAAQMLKAAGLNVQVDGSDSDKVLAQNYDPETSAALGTVVTITTGGENGTTQTEEPAPDEVSDEVPDEEANEA